MKPSVKAYLALGSNVGDRLARLRQAVGLISASPGISAEAVARVYETEPVGVRDQPWFLNTVVRVSTDLSPRDLLGAAKRVEASMGRTPTYRWGPREIDVDVLLYDDVQLSEADLVLPHPRMTERLFVLLPLRDVGPGWTSRNGTPIDELIARLSGAEEIRPHSGGIDLGTGDRRGKSG